jgi:ABC-type Zn2+ transport system substrate-binding protein/surface adhesin
MHYSPLRNNFALIPGLEVLPPVPVLETRIPETRPSSVVLETKICFAFITRYPLIEFFFQIILELVHMQTSLQISDGEGMGSIFSEVNDDDGDDGDDVDDGDDGDDVDDDDDCDDDDDYYNDNDDGNDDNNDGGDDDNNDNDRFVLRRF